MVALPTCVDEISQNIVKLSLLGDSLDLKNELDLKEHPLMKRVEVRFTLVSPDRHCASFWPREA